MENILPCPFCGKAESPSVETARSCEDCMHFEDEEKCPAYEPFDDEWEDRCPFKTVVCTFDKGGCGASGGWYPTREKAIAAWNKRMYHITEGIKI